MTWKPINTMAGESSMVLQFLLDGPFKRVRDDNHIDPHSILVWDRSRDPVPEMASHDISDDDPEITPACGTVVLIISQRPDRGHRWVQVKALIEAGQR